MDGELGTIEFIAQRPLGVEVLQGHVDAAAALGRDFPSPRLDIIANGPSAWEAPVRDLKSVMVLNGALGLCLGYGRVPEYFAACDPQAHVADFLDLQAPLETTYLLASQCHPRVFDRLRLHDFRVFHLDDGAVLPPGASPWRHGSSITLTVLLNAWRLGFSDLHIWGWDCCAIDGQHHSHGSALPTGMALRTLEHRTEPGGPTLRTFTTTNTWAYEAQQAVFAVDEMRRFGCSVTVYGDGLVRHTLDFHASLPQESPECLSAPSPMEPTSSSPPHAISSR